MLKKRAGPSRGCGGALLEGGQRGAEQVTQLLVGDLLVRIGQLGDAFALLRPAKPPPRIGAPSRAAPPHASVNDNDGAKRDQIARSASPPMANELRALLGVSFAS